MHGQQNVKKPQQLLHERASILRFTYVACIVIIEIAYVTAQYELNLRM